MDIVKLKSGFRADNWLSDLVAGSVVFLVALPLCLGIALASNAPLISGVVAGIVGGVIVGALSGSNTSVSGPAAGLTAVVAAQIALLGSFEAFLVALFIAGLIQIAFGVARMGFVAAFFPSSVIKGLLAAIGIILVLKQLPHLFGWDADLNGEMAFWQPDNENTFSEIAKMLFYMHEGAAFVGLLSLALLLIWDKVDFLKRSGIPGPLAVVGFGVLFAQLVPFFGAGWVIDSKHLVQVPLAENFVSLIGFLHWPDFSQILNPAVYLSAITIAIVASLETLLNLDAVDKLDPRQRVSPPNRELVAQGVGNSLLGLVGGLPVTAVVIRGSVNINAGARTRVSAIFHGLLLTVSLIFFPQLINQIPLSCLAAILIVTGLKLANQKIAKQMWNQGLSQFLPFTITVLAIVFTDLLIGVMIGLATGALFILHSNLRRPVKLVEESHLSGKVLRLAFANQVSFLNKAALQAAFEKVPEGGHILLDGSHCDYIDTDILDLVIDFRDKTAPARNIDVSLIGFKEHHALENHVRYVEHATSQLQTEKTPYEVLNILKEGNQRVRKGQRLHRDLGRQILATSTGQFPLGVVLSCMDSRAPVELVFDLGIGDVFSARIAGHTISEKVLGSLEFACAVAGAKLVVVMGHTRCGAVSAAIDFARMGVTALEKTGCEHLGALVEDIQKVVSQEQLANIGEKGSEEREEFEDRIVKQNVLESINAILQRSSTIHRLVENGSVAIAGCVYDVRNGSIEFVHEINHGKLSTQVRSKPREEPLLSAVDMGVAAPA